MILLRSTMHACRRSTHKCKASSLAFFFRLSDMAKARGTLSTRGWLRTPEARLDRMMTEYILANPGQTLFYRGRVRALTATIQSVGTDPDRLSSAIKTDLTKKMEMCFPERNGMVEVACHVNPDNNEINIEISMTVYEDGKAYSLSRVLANSSSYAKITDAAIM